MSTRAFITGVSGPELNAAEREFIRSARPWGFILFKRNIETPAQVIQLVQELRKELAEGEAPVLIDQEGGRVQRFGPPHWPVYPAGAVFGRLYDIDPSLGLTAARLSALSPYIGGKTGTSDDFNDAWFAGFSNDIHRPGIVQGRVDRAVHQGQRQT